MTPEERAKIVDRHKQRAKRGDFGFSSVNGYEADYAHGDRGKLIIALEAADARIAELEARLRSQIENERVARVEAAEAGAIAIEKGIRVAELEVALREADRQIERGRHYDAQGIARRALGEAT